MVDYFLKTIILNRVLPLNNSGQLNIFPGGAVVAQLAVNQLVVGSNPTPGARKNSR